MTQIDWSGYTWVAETGDSDSAQPQHWSAENVFVDSQDHLHMKISKHADGNWYSSSLNTINGLGYGTYTIKMITNPMTLANNIAVGFYTWLWNSYRDELDIEFSKWADSNNDLILQYTVWIDSWTKYVTSDNFAFNETNSIHKMTWNPDGTILFESPTANWTYNGIYKPHPGGVYTLDLWVYDPTGVGYKAPADGNEQELILESFTYQPTPTVTPTPTPGPCIPPTCIFYTS